MAPGAITYPVGGRSLMKPSFFSLSKNSGGAFWGSGIGELEFLLKSTSGTTMPFPPLKIVTVVASNAGVLPVFFIATAKLPVFSPTSTVTQARWSSRIASWVALTAVAELAALIWAASAWFLAASAVLFIT